MEGIEKERDFYFDKLTQIENVVLGSDNELFSSIKDVLYKTDVD